MHPLELDGVLRKPQIHCPDQRATTYQRYSLDRDHALDKKVEKYKLPSLTLARTHADVPGPLAYLESQPAGISMTRGRLESLSAIDF